MFVQTLPSFLPNFRPNLHQYFPNFSQFSQVFPNFPKFPQIFPNFPNFFLSFPVFPNFPQFPKVFPNISKVFPDFPRFSQFSPIFPNFCGFFTIFPPHFPNFPQFSRFSTSFPRFPKFRQVFPQFFLNFWGNLGKGNWSRWLAHGSDRDVCSRAYFLPCSRGWVFFRRSCYFFSAFAASWDNSRTFCWALGARLLEVDDEEEKALVQAQLRGPSWLGIRDSDSEGTWTRGGRHRPGDAGQFLAPGRAQRGQPGELRGSGARRALGRLSLRDRPDLGVRGALLTPKPPEFTPKSLGIHPKNPREFTPKSPGIHPKIPEFTPKSWDLGKKK
ncbi:uncharacterized protein [Agelaius tricolor]|uniref:uncharacterized protein isoform X2 n=1 Tax=Agelaius tricolor TaxID=9191 RepID=UPI0039F1CF6D